MFPVKLPVKFHVNVIMPFDEVRTRLNLDRRTYAHIDGQCDNLSCQQSMCINIKYERTNVG